MKYFLFLIISLTAFSAFAQISTEQDSVLLKQLESQMQQQPQNLTTPQSQPKMISTNPDISAIGDFRSVYQSQGDQNVEAYFKQLEVQVSSVVDPYARANFLFAFGKDLPSDEFGGSLETATLTTTSLPWGLEVTAGKFKPHFTKVNQLHPHAFSFVNFPVMIANYFGDEGLFMEGFSTSWLVPNPLDFYQEINFEIGRTTAGPTLDQGSTNDLLLIGHLKNFFDITDNSTFELGFSVLNGPDSLHSLTSMLGVDFTYKWKPVQFNTYQSFLWQTEILSSDAAAIDGSNYKSFGAYTLLEYQLSRQWFVGTRFDYSNAAKERDRTDRAGSLLLKLQPSEFQILALEFQHIQNVSGAETNNYNQIMFRVIFGIGTHAAHAY